MRWECFRDAKRPWTCFVDRNGLVILLLIWWGKPEKSNWDWAYLSATAVAHLDTDRTGYGTDSKTTATLHTLMKLCTALGWKVCHVSLHYNLDALEVTHNTQQIKKTKKTKQSLEEMQAEQTASIVGRLFRKPLVPSFPSKPCWIDMQTFVMSQCDCNGCTPLAPLLYGWERKRERLCVCWGSMSMLQLCGVM